MKDIIKFGTKGVWHKSASDKRKAEDVPVIAIRHWKKMGVLLVYEFESKSTHVIGLFHTIFAREFTQDVKGFCFFCKADLPTKK